MKQRKPTELIDPSNLLGKKSINDFFFEKDAFEDYNFTAGEPSTQLQTQKTPYMTRNMFYSKSKSNFRIKRKSSQKPYNMLRGTQRAFMVKPPTSDDLYQIGIHKFESDGAAQPKSPQITVETPRSTYGMFKSTGQQFFVRNTQKSAKKRYKKYTDFSAAAELSEMQKTRKNSTKYAEFGLAVSKPPMSQLEVEDEHNLIKMEDGDGGTEYLYTEMASFLEKLEKKVDSKITKKRQLRKMRSNAMNTYSWSRSRIMDEVSRMEEDGAVTRRGQNVVPGSTPNPEPVLDTSVSKQEQMILNRLHCKTQSSADLRRLEKLKKKKKMIKRNKKARVFKKGDGVNLLLAKHRKWMLSKGMKFVKVPEGMDYQISHLNEYYNNLETIASQQATTHLNTNPNIMKTMESAEISLQRSGSQHTTLHRQPSHLMPGYMHREFEYIHDVNKDSKDIYSMIQNKKKGIHEAHKRKSQIFLLEKNKKLNDALTYVKNLTHEEEFLKNKEKRMRELELKKQKARNDLLLLGTKIVPFEKIDKYSCKHVLQYKPYKSYWMNCVSKLLSYDNLKDSGAVGYYEVKHIGEESPANSVTVWGSGGSKKWGGASPRPRIRWEDSVSDLDVEIFYACWKVANVVAEDLESEKIQMECGLEVVDNFVLGGFKEEDEKEKVFVLEEFLE